MTKYGVYECWARARREFPDNPDAMRMRYVELMREHGNLVPKKPGDSDALPCGWQPQRPRKDFGRVVESLGPNQDSPKDGQE